MIELHAAEQMIVAFKMQLHRLRSSTVRSDQRSLITNQQNCRLLPYGRAPPGSPTAAICCRCRVRGHNDKFIMANYFTQSSKRQKQLIF